MKLARLESSAIALLVAAASAADAAAQTPAVPSGFGWHRVQMGAPLQSVSGLLATPGSLYVSDYLGSTVHELDLATGAVTPLAAGLPLSFPARLVLGDGSPLVGDDVVVTDWNTGITSACCDGAVLRLDRGTGAASALALGNPTYTTPGDPFGLALAPGGAWGDALFVMDFEGASLNPPTLYTIDQAGNAATFLTDPVQWTPSHSPQDIEFDRGGSFGGDLFVLNGGGVGGSARVWRVTPSKTLSAFVSGNALQAPVAMAFSSSGRFGDALYVLDRSGGELVVRRVSPAGAVTTFASGFPTALFGDLAFSADGETLYVGAGSEVYAIGDDAQAYCTAKVNSLGCTPAIGALGTPSAANVGPFLVSVANVRNQKSGLFFYVVNGARARVPFQGGTLCLGPAGIRRTPAQSAGGSASPANDCSGVYRLDFNAFAAGLAGGNPAPELGVPGTRYQTQSWSRDQGFPAPLNTGLSDGLDVTIGV